MKKIAFYQPHCTYLLCGRVIITKCYSFTFFFFFLFHSSARTLCVTKLVRFSHMSKVTVVATEKDFTFQLSYGACWVCFCCWHPPIYSLEINIRIFIAHVLECLCIHTGLQWMRSSDACVYTLDFSGCDHLMHVYTHWTSVDVIIQCMCTHTGPRWM